MQQLLHQFYTLLPRDERRQCLQQLLASGELTDACDAQLQALWQLRYEQKRLLRTLPDAFLNALMDLLYLDSQQQSGLSLRRLQKELQKTAGALGLDRFAGASLEEQALFLAEWQNCAAYFAHLGQEDHAYNSGILHLRPLQEQARPKSFCATSGSWPARCRRRRICRHCFPRSPKRCTRHSARSTPSGRPAPTPLSRTPQSIHPINRTEIN